MSKSPYRKLIAALRESIIREADTKRKYELYAEKAVSENQNEVAHLFKAIAFSESIHLKNHLDALSKITGIETSLEVIHDVNDDELKKQMLSTRENLRNSRSNEILEFNKIYKKCLSLAKKKNQEVAEESFNFALNSEGVHAKLITRHLIELGKEGTCRAVDFYVCKNCGDVEVEVLPLRCPTCGIPLKFYEKVE